MILKYWIGLLVVSFCLTPAWAASSGSNPADYNQAFQKWQRQLVEIRRLRDQSQEARGAARIALQQEFSTAIDEGDQLLADFTAAAEHKFQKNPDANSEVAKFLQLRVRSLNSHDEYESAARITKLLLDNNIRSPEVYDQAAEAAYMTNDFDKADRYFKKAYTDATYRKKAESLGLTQSRNKLLENLGYYKQQWKKEQAIRKSEAKANDLPRVRLATTKGDIVVELFENEAPKTVNNYVHLVEQGFYDDKSFFHVQPKLFALAGSAKWNGKDTPEFNIPCECYDNSNFRRHFRGSLSVFKTGKKLPDTGSTMFFMPFTPSKEDDGRSTVFGRVIEGIDVLAQLQRRNSADRSAPKPDRILKAEVLRKRNHPYKPDRVSGLEAPAGDDDETEPSSDEPTGDATAEPEGDSTGAEKTGEANGSGPKQQ
ncbi:MAG: peptidylprolyl isomerase [Planctomycetales bacterium]